MRVRYTRRARNDLVEIFEYIVKENRLAGAQVYLHLREVAESLGDFPYSGRAVPEFPHPGIRQRVVPPYRLVYLVAEELGEVQLLTVLHTRQQWPPEGVSGDQSSAQDVPPPEVTPDAEGKDE